MSTTGKPNILLIIADDLGADNVLITDRSPQREMFVMTKAGGPMILGELDYLSILLRNGVYFDQAWAQPVCSPTRGSLYTGTWPWRNGVGWPSSPALDPAVTALPRLLAPEGYQCGLFGKWHLGDSAGNWPTDHGWHRHIGTLEGVVNPTRTQPPPNPPEGYKNWPRRDSDNGYAVVPHSSNYATLETVNDAIKWISTVSTTNAPWFATIAFHSPHDPFHEPDGGFRMPGGITPVTNDDKFNAMAQNMDSNIGRLLGLRIGTKVAIDRAELENTVIIFLGDNGSPPETATEEPKMTIYEGGVHVPMIVADGNSVAAELNETTAPPRYLAQQVLNETSEHLVHAVDLYETIAVIAGVTSKLPTPMDSVSLWRYVSRSRDQSPARQFNFSQYYKDEEQGATIRNLDYKLNCVRAMHAGDPDWTWTWSFFEYRGHEVPGLEDSSGQDIFLAARDDLRARISNVASDNLNVLVEELISSRSYNIDDLGTSWDDPR